MDIVKLNWSGGKDSTASFLLHIDRNDVVKAVYYIPMLTGSIPLITKKHESYIKNFIACYSGPGADFIQAKGVTYWEHVHHIKTRGKDKGHIRGIGLGFGFCVFRDMSKRKALASVDVGFYEYEDIGIAADETRRLLQLDGVKKRSILAELGVTENQAFEMCRNRGCLSPVYESSFRDGCVICPNAHDDRLKEWARDYPQGVEILRDIENFCTGPKDVIYRDGSKWTDHI